MPVVFTEDLFKAESEKALGLKVKTLEKDFAKALTEQNYREAMTIFVTLKKELADFFENVMVIADEEAVKNNRLGLLGAILKMGDQLFDVESVVI